MSERDIREDEYWPKAPGYGGVDVGPWWCGGCGGLHGWDCPYRYDKRMEERHRAAGLGAFSWGPYPGGLKKEPRP